MRKHILTSLLLLSTSVTSATQLQIAKDPPHPPSAASRRHVDLVIALDTSGSMDGLIDSARQKLWDVVNLLGDAKPTPILRVGLISYGGVDGYDAERGWVRVESNLTGDLDSIYAKLFALRTSGGDEYVARAVHDATAQMHWSSDKDALKMIFVAGNEAATQDPKIRIEQALEEARGAKIFVNAIYCGSPDAGDAAGWASVAQMGAGRFATIDQNHVATIATPMDAELEKLSTQLNDTYIGYGAGGAQHKKNQAEQDRNAHEAGVAAAPARAMAKASKLYRADDWDLVDAAKGGKSVASMPAAALPAPMQAMKPEERQAFVDGKAKERTQIQKRIGELSQARELFVKKERAKKAPTAQKDLNDALSESIRSEAKSAGFAF